MGNVERGLLGVLTVLAIVKIVLLILLFNALHEIDLELARAKQEQQAHRQWASDLARHVHDHDQALERTLPRVEETLIRVLHEVGSSNVSNP